MQKPYFGCSYIPENTYPITRIRQYSKIKVTNMKIISNLYVIIKHSKQYVQVMETISFRVAKNTKLYYFKVFHSRRK